MFYSLTLTIRMTSIAFPRTCVAKPTIYSTFSNPVILQSMFTTHCLSLYGAISWSLANKQLRSLEVSFNNLLRKIWFLPMQCHTGILHCVAQAPSVINRIVDLFTASYLKASANGCPLIRQCYSESSHLLYTPIGYNWRWKQNYRKNYSEDDLLCSSVVRDIRLQHLTFESTELSNSILYSICCD